MKEFHDVYSSDKYGEQLVLGKDALTLKVDEKGISIVYGATEDGEQSLLFLDKNQDAVISVHGNKATITVGHEQQPGSITVMGRYGRAGVTLNGGTADVTIGGFDNGPGDLYVRDGNNRNAIVARGNDSLIRLGLQGRGGDLRLVASNGRRVARIDTDGDQETLAHFELGGVDRAGKLSIKNASDTPTIEIRGDDGDIEFFNADFAEEFDIAPEATDLATPGTVMVLNEEGTLEPCREAYASTVVGVVAGAGGYRPALVLDKQTGSGRKPIAMVGKVFCRADANQAPIRMGDLLTTSSMPGHAMKVTDRMRGFGSVIGKALGNLEHGQGLLRVLVNLQ